MKSTKNKKKTQPIDAESLYLSRLNFDESQRGRWVEVLFTNPRLIVLSIVGIIVFGLFSFFNLPRELNPDVVIPAVTVVTALPGAAPKDVEVLISQKIEDAAPNLPNIDTVSSRSTEGLSVVTFLFTTDQDSDEALRATKEEVDALIDELPDDATTPKITKVNINDRPFLTIALVGDADRWTLSQIATEIETELESISGISRVDVSAAETEEVVVQLRPDSLATYAVSANTITTTLKANNLTFPAGIVTAGGLEYSVSVNNELNSLEKIRALPIAVGSKTIPLGEVADVYLRTKELKQKKWYGSKPESTQTSWQHHTAVELSLYKADGETITAAAEKSKEKLAALALEYPQIQVVDIQDFSKEIARTFSDLQGNFYQSVGLLFMVLALFLGLRPAGIAALSIPLVLLCTFIAMQLMGQTINFLSLFSVLLALSLIGDDAIVIAQATAAYSKKFPPLETGLMIFKDFFVPIWVGTITVVWSFVPLLLSTGIIGEFIKPIPLVVTATLLSSTAIATLINLPVNIILMSSVVPKRVILFIKILLALAVATSIWAFTTPHPAAAALAIFALVFLALLQWSWQWFANIFSKSKEAVQNRYPGLTKISQFSGITLGPIVKWYQKIATQLVEKRRYRIAVFATVIVLIVVSGVFVATGALKSEFFPKTDEDTLYVNIEGAPGQTESELAPHLAYVRSKIETHPEVTALRTVVGTLSSAEGAGSTGSNKASIQVFLTKPAERDTDSLSIAASWRNEFSQYTGAMVTVQELSGGPPAGAQFQINIRGESLATLETIATDFQNTLKSITGVVNTESSLKLSAGQIDIQLDRTELAERGLSAQQVGAWLRTSLSGSEASTVVFDTENTDITVAVADSIASIEMLGTTKLPSSLGSYTLSEVATFKLENNPLTIEREDNQKVVRVTAEGQGISSPEIQKAFEEKIKEYDIPSGYTWDLGGQNEENEKSVASIISAMRISFFLILITMVLQLRSFRKALLVVGVIPLALIGVVINFTIFGIPLSFPALIGVLSLFGIVVNNALMLMEKINLNLEHDFTLKEAVIDGASSRLEAIALSSIASIMGLLPVTLSDPLWQGLGGAIIAGLSVSGFLILLLLPSLYIEIFGEKE